MDTTSAWGDWPAAMSGTNRALEKASATCRHCGRHITRLENGHWVDTDGWYACIKGPVLHEPMPDGLRGEPS